MSKPIIRVIFPSHLSELRVVVDYPSRLSESLLRVTCLSSRESPPPSRTAGLARRTHAAPTLPPLDPGPPGPACACAFRARARHVRIPGPAGPAEDGHPSRATERGGCAAMLWQQSDIFAWLLNGALVQGAAAIAMSQRRCDCNQLQCKVNGALVQDVIAVTAQRCCLALQCRMLLRWHCKVIGWRTGAILRLLRGIKVCIILCITTA